jgi:hypothetical protein
VQIRSQVNVMGILAQFGRGMIQDVSDQMFDKFVAAARAELETTPVTPPAAGGNPAPSAASDTTRTADPAGAPPIEVLSFGSAVVGRAIRRAARKPEVWIGAGLALAVVWWWRRR